MRQLQRQRSADDALQVLGRFAGPAEDRLSAPASVEAHASATAGHQICASQRTIEVQAVGGRGAMVSAMHAERSTAGVLGMAATAPPRS